MGMTEDELRRRVGHMRQEREHVDFMERTAALVRRRLARGVPAGQRESMAASVDGLLRANRAVREAARSAPEPRELAAEAALEALRDELRS